MKHYLLIFSFLQLFSIVIGQEATPFCATDEMHQKMFADKPELNPGIVRANERLENFTRNYVKQGTPKVDEVYVIPVVFHIIHNGGAENIDDSQILDAMKQLNIQFRKQNADTSEIVTSFKSIAADVEVEFRLAQLDPDGNCTSGITRTVSPLTMIGDHQVKSLIHWPPNKYLNVYVCSEAAGLAGHALLPSAADTIPEWDGIVMQHSYIGTIGTSDYFRRTVLSHEIGHFLNLQHIWGGNNVPDYYYLPVAQSSNCDVDDEVDDTPLTIGWQTCNLNGTSCSTLDNVQNYMDYSYCARMFTEGQKARMHACLNSPVANRNNLWSPANRIATGTDDVNAVLCAAKFEATKRIVCVGEAVELTDVSYHGIESRDWDIVGAQLSSTTDSIVTATFDTPGLYSVTLAVTKGMENEVHTETDFIRVLPAIGLVNGVYESFEYEPFFNTQWAIAPRELATNWAVNEEVGFNSNQSISLINFETAYTGSFEFISEPIDASGLSALLLTFDYAYARRYSSGSEVLQIAVSTDCGETWNVRRTFSGLSTLSTVDTLVTSSFVPVDNTQWSSEAVTNITSSYLTNDLLIKFKFDTRGGNNLYLDNIRIAHPDVIGLPEALLEEIKVFPNPASEKLIIEFPESIVFKNCFLTDLGGKSILCEVAPKGLYQVEIPLETVANGMYLLNLETSSGTKVLKVVVDQN